MTQFPSGNSSCSLCERWTMYFAALEPLVGDAARHDAVEQRVRRLGGPGPDEGLERLEGRVSLAHVHGRWQRAELIAPSATRAAGRTRRGRWRGPRWCRAPSGIVGPVVRARAATCSETADCVCGDTLAPSRRDRADPDDAHAEPGGHSLGAAARGVDRLAGWPARAPRGRRRGRSAARGRPRPRAARGRASGRTALPAALRAATVADRDERLAQLAARGAARRRPRSRAARRAGRRRSKRSHEAPAAIAARRRHGSPRAWAAKRWIYVGDVGAVLAGLDEAHAR